MIELLDRVHTNVYPFIVQIGTGGTGGYIMQHISQMLGTLEYPHTYVVADPDTIEQKNLRNQLFLEDEIGLKKAVVLAERYANAYNLNIATYTEKYLENSRNILSLFSKDYLYIGDTRNTKLLPILIGAVDNAYTRKMMHEAYKSMPSCIYIDAGNESCVVPNDWQVRPITQWSEEEQRLYKDSGWSGQVVCGVRLNYTEHQPPVCGVHPDILEDDDSTKPSEMSCSDLTASEPQRLIVNKFAALAVCNFLNDILEEKRVTSHITRFHARKGYMRTFDYDPSN